MRKLSNGQGLPVEYFCGGYLCRHRWVLVPVAAASAVVPSRSPLPDDGASADGNQEGAGRPSRSAVTPLGTAVSAALQAPPSGPLRAPLQAALEAIDAVHGDGVLPSIPVEVMRSATLAGGYEYQISGLVSTRIRVRPTPDAAGTIVHEVGHFLDQKGLPGGDVRRFSSEDEKLLDAWRKSVTESATFKTLKAAARTGRLPSGLRVGRDEVTYRLEWKELWARAYFQYITERSGSAVLRADLERIRTGYFSLEQWPDEEFGPILREIDTLFQSLGWLRLP